MTYIFNAMSSVPVTPFINSIVDEYLKDSIISVGNSSATLKLCTANNEIVPATISIGDEVIYSSKNVSGCEDNEISGIQSGFSIKEYRAIRKKIISKIKKTYPNGTSDVFTVLKKGAAIYDYREYDNIMGEDISEFIDSEAPLKFARMSLYPETLDSLGMDTHVLNIVRSPIIDFVVDIQHGSQEDEPWPRVEGIRHTLIEDMILSLLYNELDDTGRVTTFRYEDTFRGADIQILDKTFSIPLSGVNSYISTYDMSAIKDKHIGKRIDMIPEIEKLILLDNCFREGIDESRENINVRKANNLKGMKGILKMLDDDVICPPLIYMGEDDFDLYNKLTVPLFDRYSKVHGIIRDIKSNGLTFSNIFRYPVIRDVKALI